MAVGRYRDMFGINFYQIDQVRELTMYPVVPLGNNSAERWERAYNQLRKAGLVSRPFSADDFVHDPIQNLKHRAERTERWIKHGLLMLGSFLLLASTAYWCHWIQQRKAAARLHREANYDALTGLANRTCALRKLSSAIERQRSHSQTVSVFFIDLDGFKRVNDTFGHYVGDLLLCAAATRLNNLCVSPPGRRECFHVSRLGGDEFLLIAKDLTLVDIKPVAESILDSLSQVFNLAGKELHIGASVGIATVWRGTITCDALLQRADAAMYLAKTSGRNQYRIYDSGLGRALLEKNTIEEQLGYALSKRELLLNYQPIISVESGRMVGAEVLLRWHNDKLGQVAPDRFIPVAEESGLIGEIGLWVLDTALQQQARWQQQYDADLELAINLSPKQFSVGFYDSLQASALAAGVRPETVKLEITEGLLASSNGETTALLQRIADAGYHLSIDDFGTGYSSLNYLRTFPASTLKIDRSFVSQLTDDRNQALVTAIVKMAHSLGLSVVAEGIETEQQEVFLRQQQCDYLQGYRYGKPVTAEAFSRLLSIEAGRASGDVVPMQRRVISAVSKTVASDVERPVSASLV
jgi:diguanylate cyclase (GGDEF)-like protein